MAQPWFYHPYPRWLCREGASVPVEGLLACKVGRCVTESQRNLTQADRRWRNVRIGASLDVKDEVGGGIPESDFKDCVSNLGVANDFDCKAEKELSTGDGDAVVNASSLESGVESGESACEVCKPPSPLAIADNRSPSPSDVLRCRAVELSSIGLWGKGWVGSSEA